MVPSDGWKTRGRRVSHRDALTSLSVSSGHDLARPSRISAGVVEQGANVVHKERIKHFCNLFLVCKIQCAFIGDPDEGNFMLVFARLLSEKRGAQRTKHP